MTAVACCSQHCMGRNGVTCSAHCCDNMYHSALLLPTTVHASCRACSCHRDAHRRSHGQGIQSVVVSLRSQLAADWIDVSLAVHRSPYPMYRACSVSVLHCQSSDHPREEELRPSANRQAAQLCSALWQKSESQHSCTASALSLWTCRSKAHSAAS